MPQFRKKPVVIEAVRYAGLVNEQNVLVPSFPDSHRPAWLLNALNKRAHTEGAIWVNIGGSLRVGTLEGHHTANVSDYIIRGVQGELYPCKPDIFEATYEPVDSPAPTP